MPYKDKEKRLAVVRAWRKAHPDYHRAKFAAKSAAFPEIVRAGRVVRNALRRGRLTRPSECEECGGAGPIQAAHYSYAPDQFLNVRWLCVSCHIKWDKAVPKLFKEKPA